MALSRVRNSLRKSLAFARETVPTYRHLTVVKSCKQIFQMEEACKSQRSVNVVRNSRKAMRSHCV